jgi:hypothetical protein
MQFRAAQPSQAQMERLNEVERELGFVLVAYAQEQATPALAPALTADQTNQLKNLSEEQFERLHTLEEETGLVLMAYQA